MAQAANPPSKGASTKANRPPRPKVVGEPQVRILLGSSYPLGPGKVRLLEAVAKTGSISAAARAANMSYRRAWVLIDEVNHLFRGPLVETTTGGKGGGGARLTDLGETALARYHAIETKVRSVVEREVAALGELLAKPKRSPG
ncbi:MAG: LysR family transcriptional regulator [Alphaproteobacteria bacterium]|nr:LysR family transcriptional regulator [Alphaproteobacteria bacterium]